MASALADARTSMVAEVSEDELIAFRYRRALASFLTNQVRSDDDLEANLRAARHWNPRSDALPAPVDPSTAAAYERMHANLLGLGESLNENSCTKHAQRLIELNDEVGVIGTHLRDPRDFMSDRFQRLVHGLAKRHALICRPVYRRKLAELQIEPQTREGVEVLAARLLAEVSRYPSYPKYNPFEIEFYFDAYTLAEAITLAMFGDYAKDEQVRGLLEGASGPELDEASLGALLARLFVQPCAQFVAATEDILGPARFDEQILPVEPISSEPAEARFDELARRYAICTSLASLQPEVGDGELFLELGKAVAERTGRHFARAEQQEQEEDRDETLGSRLRNFLFGLARPKE